MSEREGGFSADVFIFIEQGRLKFGEGPAGLSTDGSEGVGGEPAQAGLTILQSGFEVDDRFSGIRSNFAKRPSTALSNARVVIGEQGAKGRDGVLDLG